MRKFILLAVIAAIIISTLLYGQTSKKKVSLPSSEEGYYMIKLNENTFVTGKDMGDSQLIMVFKVSQQGQLILTQKSKFMY